jgi:hypothetical protein
MGDFTEPEFTRVEAEMKKGIKVCVIVDGAFREDELVKGTTGKVFDAKSSSILSSAGSLQAPAPNRDVWVVSVLFDNPRKIVEEISKREYYHNLKEIP